MLQHQASVRVIHDESGFDLGEFRSKSGGAREGENTLVRAGGMTAPLAMPGTSALSELTCARLLRHGADSGLVQRVHDWHGERFTVNVQRLDAKGRPGFHRPEVYSGLLNTSTPPDVDADGNDPATLELAFTVDSLV